MSFLKIKDENGNFIPVKALNGKTPVKGVDYFNEADKQEIINYASENIVVSDNNLPIVPIAKGGTGASDALNALLNLKGLPIISAVGSNNDMNTIAETGELALYSYNGNTLNTPYKAGLTSATLGYILNIPNDNYPTQLALGNGATRPYYRKSWNLD